MVPEKLVILLFAVLGQATWADADVVDVRHAGPVDLAPFVCTDITRSTMIGRACYNAATQSAIIEVRSTYRQFCNLPKPTFDALLDAPSMGQFYRKHIQGSKAAASYACAPRPRQHG
ncbi:MAG: KTSC domain-containing protein [Xanthobacteraceae bacterium]|nr:KTSC domain-containing protein [Xanthobacteraceae bacterium]